VQKLDKFIAEKTIQIRGFLSQLQDFHIMEQPAGLQNDAASTLPNEDDGEDRCYRYEITPDRVTWQEGRDYCRRKGGDLAHHGFQDIATRQKIVGDAGLRLHDTYECCYFFGVQVSADDDKWRLMNGREVSTPETFWQPDYPLRKISHDCAVLYVHILMDSPQDWVDLSAYNQRCDTAFPAICEFPC